jgi:glycosyltransferase involved in cell wall biosynthesis
MSKVYFISSGNEGCYNVRCLLPLVANGWDGDRTSLSLTTKTPENKSRAAQNADIVVFHRPETHQKVDLARLLKKQGKKIVFDNDDTYKDPTAVKLNDFMDAERTKRGLANANRMMDAFAIEADLVTCTTEFLADEYRKLNPNVVVLPNCVDPDYFDEPLRNETDIVRIGITGSVGSTTDLEAVAPIIRHYEHDPRVKIVFFSLPPNRKENPLMGKIFKDEYAFLDSVDVEWHGTTNPDVYYEKLNELRLDIMIIPRADGYFNRCKSNLKFLEASMFEIPCIVQGFEDGKSPYQVNPEDGKYCTIVTDNTQWIPEIEKLIVDKELRREMGRKAHEYVASEYNIEKHAYKWEETYGRI